MIYAGDDTYYCTGYKYSSPNYMLVVSKSTDGGLNWTRQTIQSGSVYGYIRALAVDPSNTDNVFALGYYNSAVRCYYSENGGTSWQERSMSGLQGTPYDLLVHPTSSNRMAAATSTGLFATDDGGATWTRVTTAFTGAWCVTVPEGTEDLLVGTNANGAWIWEDWSGTPALIGTDLDDVRVNVLIDVPEYSLLYAGTFGNSMWTNYYGTSTEGSHSATPNALEFAVHPNPVTSGTATASFVLPTDSQATLQVFDLTGRVVLEHQPAPGDGQSILNLSSLPPGAYISRLTSGTESATVRMIVTR